jgi:hypothetical protein
MKSGNRITRNERWARAFLQRVGLPDRTELAQVVSEHHRFRVLWAAFLGVWILWSAAWLMTGDPFRGSASKQLIFDASIILFLSVGVSCRPIPTRGGTVRSASLTSRSIFDLLPTWAVILPFVTLTPCLLLPLWTAGADVGSWSKYTWHPAVMALLALGALVASRRDLLHRRLAADDAELAYLDLVLRALTLKLGATLATALGLVLLSSLEARPGDAVSLDMFTPLGWVAWGLALAVIILGGAARLPDSLRTQSPVVAPSDTLG